jgi:glutamate formiminotransferase
MRTLCIVYVSEASRQAVIAELRQAATNGGILAHSFTDSVYGRTSFFLLGDNIIDRSLALCRNAFENIDYRFANGTHPALGVVDHVRY